MSRKPTKDANDQLSAADHELHDWAKHAASLRERLAAMSEAIQVHMVDIGVLLAEIQCGQYWRGEFPTFAEYVENVVGISLRKAQELIKVIRQCAAAGIAPSEIAAIGWSKVAIVASELNASNAKQLLADVKSQSCRQLKEARKGEGSPKKKASRQRGKVVLTDIVDEALRLASIHTRDVALQSNLEFMAAKFLELCPLPSRLPTFVMN